MGQFLKHEALGHAFLTGLTRWGFGGGEASPEPPFRLVTATCVAVTSLKMKILWRVTQRVPGPPNLPRPR
jgi:hypothetical protein